MIWRLALRSIRRNPRRTILTLSAMVLSAVLLILILAISEAFMADLLTTTTRQYSGQAVVAAAGYLADQDLYTCIREPRRVLEALGADPRVKGASARLRAYGIFAAGKNTVAGELLGVSWKAEAGVTVLANHLVAGRYPEDDRGTGLYIGAGLAEKLGVAVGGEVIFVTQAADGSIGNEMLRVEGIYRTGDPGHDTSLALTGIDRLGSVLALEGRAHEVALLFGRPEEADVLAADIGPRLAAIQDDLRTVSWRQLLPILSQAMDYFSTSMLVMTVILYLAAGMVVVNTLFMSFHERLREFGLLMALGMTPGAVRRLLLAEALVLGLAAVLLSTIGGVAASFVLYRYPIDISAYLEPVSFGGGSAMPVITAVLKWRDLLVPIFGLLIMTLLAVLPTAIQGGRRPPAEDLQRGG